MGDELPPSRPGMTLAERSARSGLGRPDVLVDQASQAVDADGPQSGDSRRLQSRTRHWWVVDPADPGRRLAGLVLEWRRDRTAGWSALVLYLADAGASSGEFDPDPLGSGRAVTALLNRVELVSDDVVRLRDDLGISMPWRHDDVVATWSMTGSGIGYHVGHEDGFIVQLAGSRRWRIFPPAASEAASHLAALGDPDFADHLTTRPDGAEPVLEVELQAGDAVAVPALHPHEGVTLEGPSLSLSVGWRGLNAHRLLREAGVIGSDHRVAAAAKAAWFGLLPDRPVEEMRTVVEERVRRCLDVAPLPAGPEGDDPTDTAVQRVGEHWDAGCPR